MRKEIFHICFGYIHIFREQYTLEATSGQSWHNYIGPRRDNPREINKIKQTDSNVTLSAKSSLILS